jgi:hypothetical protein
MIFDFVFFFLKNNINYNMTYKSKNRQFKEEARFAFDILKESKIKTIIVSVVVLIALLTGIIVAARTHTAFASIDNYGIIDVKTGTLTTTFFTRFFSMLFIGLILLGCSFSVYLFPIGVVFIAYRAYLLGLNICLMIVHYGFSGVIVTIIVAFPCQLIALALMCLFFILMSKTIKDFKCFGGCRVPKQRMKIIICGLLCLLIICIFESLLLLLFSAKVILVI